MKLSSSNIGLTLACLMFASALQAQQPSPQEIGKRLAFDASRGNCLACHAIDDGNNTSALAPPLGKLQLRFKDKLSLKTFIWDASAKNPTTIMPAYGRDKILSDEEIELIVNYIWRL